MTTFTTDDVGKTVESATGDPLGAIVEVDDETAYVEPDPGVADSLKATLDWAGSDEAIPLADSAVAEITDDAIRLESSFPEGSLEPSDAAGGGVDDPDAPEPTTADDEFYDDPAEGPRVDPSDRMEEPDDREGVDRTPIEADRDAVETTASRELEVDPTELTEGEPESDIRVTEDVGDRTGADADAGGARPADGGTGRADEPSGPTTEDAGSIDAEMPAASERSQEAESDGSEGSETDDDGEEHDLDEGR